MPWRNRFPQFCRAVAEQPPVETRTTPLDRSRRSQAREFRFDFRDEPWLVRIELSDDPAEGDWLSISDQRVSTGGPETIEIRVSMAHPFMVAFAQTDADSIEPLLARRGGARAVREARATARA